MHAIPYPILLFAKGMSPLLCVLFFSSPPQRIPVGSTRKHDQVDRNISRNLWAFHASFSLSISPLGSLALAAIFN